MDFAETLVIRDKEGKSDTFIFLDPAKTEKLPIPEKKVFKWAVSFIFDHRGKIFMDYPVISEDYTNNSGDEIIKIKRKEVPSAIKSAMTKWLKLQPKD